MSTVPAPMTRARSAALLATLALVAGCGSTHSKEKSMTPDEARAHLSQTIVAVLEAGVPGGAPELDSSALNDGIPCGGLGGNEFNKIKHSIDATTITPAADPVAALRRMRAKLSELGYDNGQEDIGDYQLLIFSDSSGAGGGIQVYPSGRISVDAATPCLDNPDE